MTINPTLPLTQYPLIHSKDLDEARLFYSQNKMPVRAETTARRVPFEWRGNMASAGPLSLSASSFAGKIRVWTESIGDLFSLLVPLASNSEALINGASVPLTPGETGLLSSPGQSGDIRMELGYRSLELSIPRRLMESALSSLAGADPKGPLLFEPKLSLDAKAGAGALRLMNFMLSEFELGEGGLLSTPLIASQLTDTLLSHLLLTQPHNQSKLLQLQPTPAEPLYVRLAAEYLDAHAAEPLSLMTLATLTGMSTRSLQAGFRRHRRCSITEFLRERRLALVRVKLLGSPKITVARAASSCGFEHLGRFSAMYRARFGESPVETLRRTQG